MLPLRSEPRSESALDVADWIELQLILGPPWRVSEANAREFLDRRGLGDSFGSAVAGAIGVMRRRSGRLSKRYPIVPLAGGLARRDRSISWSQYAALLTICCVDFGQAPALLLEVTSLFEEYCEGVLRDLGGDAARAIHFGSPSRSGRPEGFSDAIRWLAHKLGLQAGSGYRDPRRNDGGVDLVSWRVLPDGRSYDVRLTQCTIERSLLSKARDIDVDQWVRWIGFAERPRIAIAVPYQVPLRSVEAREATNLGSLVLDRLALIESANEGEGFAVAAAHKLLGVSGISALVEAAQ